MKYGEFGEVFFASNVYLILHGFRTIVDDQSSKKAENLKKQKYNVFLVHPSDKPTVVLLSRLLTGNNHGTQARVMTMALQAKNKLSFVDGTISKPDHDDGRKWQHCNDLVGP